MLVLQKYQKMCTSLKRLSKQKRRKNGKGKMQVFEKQ